MTPHERFFSFQRRSCTGTSLPSWMTSPGSKVYVKRFTRSSKSEPLVEEAEIMHVNPSYANIRYPNGGKLPFHCVICLLVRQLKMLCPKRNLFQTTYHNHRSKKTTLMRTPTVLLLQIKKIWMLIPVTRLKPTCMYLDDHLELIKVFLP